MERTLSIIKPDGVSRGLIGDVVKHIEGRGLKIVAMECSPRPRPRPGGFMPCTGSGRSSKVSPRS